MDNQQEYNYDKYIWQIQFRPWYISPQEYTYNTTIDLLNRLLTVRKTITNTHMVNQQIYEIDEADYERLIPYLEIQEIRSFEEKNDADLKQLDCGYRDGWRLKYSYFTHGVPPRTDGSLGIVYKGNPLEEIVRWVLETYPDADIRL